jgi:hypothetical protein
MVAFTLSCVALKLYHPQLPRLVVTSWPVLVAGLVSVLVGWVGNLALDPLIFKFFLLCA